MSDTSTPAPAESLVALIEAGLSFGECVHAFAAREDYDPAVIAAARRRYEREGEIEIDDSAIVSEGEDGAYVMAWVFVDPEATEEERT